MKKKEKVGLLIPNLESGGAEHVVAKLSYLLNEDYEVYIFLFDAQNIKYEYNGTLIDMKSEASENLFKKITTRIKRIIKLSYYIRRYNIDVCISFLYSANIVNAYSIGVNKKIVSVRGYSDFLQNNSRYYKLSGKYDKLLVQTKRMKDEFESKYNMEGKIQVLANPFNIKWINDQSKQKIENKTYEFIDNHKTICTMGTFKKDKGYWHLIKAFCEVKKKIPDCGLLIVGSGGEMEQEILEMAKRTKYEKDILFIGYKKNPFKYISKCELYISTSINEGFPNAIVEAMATGLPVISTDCKTGPKEILSNVEKKHNEVTVTTMDKYGVLTPPVSSNVDFDFEIIENETKEVAKSIIELLSNKQLLKRYSKLSLKRAQDYDIDSFTKELKASLTNY